MILNNKNKNLDFNDMRKLRSERRNPPLPRKSMESEMNIYNSNYEKNMKKLNLPEEIDEVSPNNSFKVNHLISSFNNKNDNLNPTKLNSPRDLESLQKDKERKPSFLIDKYNLIESSSDTNLQKNNNKPLLPRRSSEKNIKQMQIEKMDNQKPKPPPLPPKKKPKIPPPPNYLPKIYKATIPSPTTQKKDSGEEIFTITPIKQMGNSFFFFI
jgi:septum formation inhibitor MinC